MVKPWRIPEYHFLVRWPWGQMRCREAVGLTEVHGAESPAGGGEAQYLSHMAGGMPGNLVLKHITLTAERGFRGWLMQFRAARPQPMAATVSLIFDNKPPSVIWSLSNAWPVHIGPVDAVEDGAYVMIDQISLTHSGMMIIKS